MARCKDGAPQFGQSNEVLLWFGLASNIDAEHSEAGLLDKDALSRKGGLLTTVTFELDAGLGVVKVVGCDGRMVRDLLDGELSWARGRAPFTKVKFTEDRIERLLL